MTIAQLAVVSIFDAAKEVVGAGLATSYLPIDELLTNDALKLAVFLLLLINSKRRLAEDWGRTRVVGSAPTRRIRTCVVLQNVFVALDLEKLQMLDVRLFVFEQDENVVWTFVIDETAHLDQLARGCLPLEHDLSLFLLTMLSDLLLLRFLSKLTQIEFGHINSSFLLRIYICDLLTIGTLS